MKTNLLNIIAAAAIAAFTPARAEEKKDEAQSKSSSSSSVTTNADGTATVTIEVNGKKETKTFKLGDGKPFTFKVEDGGAVAIAGGGAGKAEPAKKEKVTWLGVATGPVGDDVRAQLPLKDGEAITITHVVPESPAAKAGIEAHDILTRFDSQIIVSPEQLKTLVKMHKAGDKVKLSTLRKGQPREAEVTFEEHEVEVGRDDPFLKWLDAPGIQRLPGRNFLRGDDDDKNPIGESLRNKLKDMKERFPGVIVDRKAFIFGPDGKTQKLEGDFKLDDILELTRKHLDEANLPADVREQIRKSVEEAVKSGTELFREKEGRVGELKKENEELRREIEKAKGELEKAKEPQKQKL
jgi:PDZ domain